MTWIFQIKIGQHLCFHYCKFSKVEFIHLCLYHSNQYFCGLNDGFDELHSSNYWGGVEQYKSPYHSTIQFCKSCQMIPMVNGKGNAWIVCYSVWIWRMLIQYSIVHVAKARRDEELARGLPNSGLRLFLMISHFLLQILHFFSIILHSNITTAVISLLMTACQEDFTTVVQTAKVWTYQ